MKKKILMACLHYWQSPYQVATHHLARQFAKAGWSVLYVSAPITPMHILKSHDATVRHRLRLALQEPRVEYIGSGSVTAVIPLSLIAPDNRYPLNTSHVINSWTQYNFRQLQKIINELSFNSIELIYFDNFYSAPLKQLVVTQKSVYHMADNYSGFPGYTKDFFHAEKILIRDIDVVLYPSKELETYVQTFKPKKTLFLPNGVDIDWFKEKSPAPPIEYSSIPTPIAVYVGAIEAWFDFELVAKAAASCPHISFVLIGQGGSARKNLPNLPNIYILGTRMRDQLPPYLHYANVGIIPFNVLDYPDLLDPVRPLKLLEYFATGLPCLSMTWSELILMNAPVTLATNHDDFISLLAELISDPSGTSIRKEYASKYDWNVIFSRLIDELKSE